MLEVRVQYDLFLESLNPLGRIKKLKEEVRLSREELDHARLQIERLEKDNGRLHEETNRLEQDKSRLEREKSRLEEENARLRKELQAAQRSARRQAAPFSRGKREEKPKRPGRKSGAAHGAHHQRAVPDHVDEEIQVEAPVQCPDCGGPLTVERTEVQYQEEIVRRTVVRRFLIPICRCEQCSKRVQGRHELQTSDALGAAAVQIGPEAVTLGVLMNKGMGLPHGDAATILQQGFGLTMSRGGICRAIQRVARKAEATWHALREAARRSELAHMDETGWKVDAQLSWLWAVVTAEVTYCEILPGRGFDEAASILGADYGGWLIHDGLRIYYKFLKASHQSCAWHLLARCRKMVAAATPRAAVFPLAVQEVLQTGLDLRDRYAEEKISLHGLWTATGRLEAKLDRLLARNWRDAENRRFAKHLRHERPYLFTFLYCPGIVDASNNVAERVMRILVMIRKNWGGNRTANGARVQAVLTSILCTARQQDKDAFELLTGLLRSPRPKLLDLIGPAKTEVSDFIPAPVLPPSQRGAAPALRSG